MSNIEMLKAGKEALVNAIIRPPRADYEIEELGPQKFQCCEREFERTDLELVNPRGQKLQCSWWQPSAAFRQAPLLPCVIYMHGNSSCRVEVLQALSTLLSLGVTAFAFDFSGCGKSDGDYISLGYHEREDLVAVTNYLRKSQSVSTIGLWGRSMGAATALLHGDRDPSIAGMVLDSPFTDLTQLAGELVEVARGEGWTVPGFVVSAAMKWIGSQVKSKAQFNIKDLSPITHADRTFIPALFVHGEQDDFIKPHHSKQIFEKYAGDKELLLVPGDHVDERPDYLFSKVQTFFRNSLRLRPEVSLDLPLDLTCPPWYTRRFQQSDLRTMISDMQMSEQNLEDEMIRRAIALSLQSNPTPQSPSRPLPTVHRVQPHQELVSHMNSMQDSALTARSRVAVEHSEKQASDDEDEDDDDDDDDDDRSIEDEQDQSAFEVVVPRPPSPQREAVPTPVVPQSDLLARMVAMGFDDALSAEMLSRTNNDIRRALDLMLSMQ
eukprot:c3836_g1_i2.p1 GENE.c3836_g1_i2~~c3836_g1_i2.p1  ORF type:complete len:527 (-),score=149.21 c3836_g1_i2:137-1615(-)